jgi:hypothetical protein
MDLLCLTLNDLAELEPTENTTDITLRWHEGPFLKEVLPVLKRWRHSCRLTIVDFPENIDEVPFEDICAFIMAMEHLSYLHFVPQREDHLEPLSYEVLKLQLEFLVDKVRELILPQRPNFKFDISRISVM